MANANAAFDQILETVRQLPESQRRKLMRKIESLPQPVNAKASAQRLRNDFRMDERQRERMTILLSKGREGSLTAEEKAELKRTIAEFEKKTLALAQAIDSDSSSTGARVTR
jgi:hypothetical protein